MNLFKLEQYRMVLEVLEQMKDCIDRGEIYTNVKGKPFNITRQFGICWHVYAHTPDHKITGIDCEFLCPAFIELGLNQDYPVEGQTVPDISMMRALHWNQRNLYDRDNIHGANRIKLVDSLIQYYQDKIKTPITSTMYEHYYNNALCHLQLEVNSIDAVNSVLDFNHNPIWHTLAVRISEEDPTMAEVQKDISYPKELTLVNVVTCNLQSRIISALESL